MNEAFLQYIWQHSLLEGDLRTLDGQEVQIVRSGTINLNAGPDFLNAQVTIGGIAWVGNIELHVRSTDWNRHGHSNDRQYDNVILHAVYTYDGDIDRTADKPQVPTLVLKDYIPAHVMAHYEVLMNPPKSTEIPCGHWLKQMPTPLVNSWLERLAVERIEKKTEVVGRLLDDSQNSWADCCYWLIAHYFGGKVNAFAFEMTAKATPLTVLAKIKDDPMRVEALLFGQAGMLDGDFDDDYPRQLQTEYRYMRKAWQLTPVNGWWWKFFRLRPSGFPTLRLSQFASLVSGAHSLFSEFLAADNARQLARYFQLEASEYWRTHYRFDKPSPHPHSVQTGDDMAENIIVNAWVPLLFRYGVQHGDQKLQERAYDLLCQMPAEHNNIVKRWKTLGIAAENAAQSQALVQLYNNYCSERNCLRCHMGSRVLRIIDTI
ncbi:MAG: DUF2851 family protein [Bacteroidales bacterium]|nr:DUF2851 family protein [Bacteroidales bacterium]